MYINKKKEVKAVIKFGGIVHKHIMLKGIEMCTTIPPISPEDYKKIAKELKQTYKEDFINGLINGPFCMKAHSIWYAQDDILGAVCSKVLFGKDGKIDVGNKDMDWYYEISKYQSVGASFFNGPGDKMVQRNKDCVIARTDIDNLKRILKELYNERKIEEADYILDPQERIEVELKQQTKDVPKQEELPHPLVSIRNGLLVQVEALNKIIAGL